MDTQILLVEDDAKARMLLAAILTDAGYHVTAVPDGEAAVSTLRQQPFAVVLTDIRMRAIDGIQVLGAAKALDRPPAVVLLTGYGSLETSIAALRASADDYLLKPCDPTNLLSCVANALRRRAEQLRKADVMDTIFQSLDQLRGAFVPSPAASDGDRPAEQPERYLRVGNLTLDCFRHAATFLEQPLHLTPIEYALLQCLAAAQGRVVAYNEIVRRTHGHVVDDAEAQLLIKPHIRNLRRKFDPAYLVNVRGTGFVLAPPPAD